MKFKCHFEDVDQVIAKVNSATVENKTRQPKFASIGCSHQPVVARWKSWLNAALYYSKNLPAVKAIAKKI